MPCLLLAMRRPTLFGTRIPRTHLYVCGHERSIHNLLLILPYNFYPKVTCKISVSWSSSLHDDHTLLFSLPNYLPTKGPLLVTLVPAQAIDVCVCPKVAYGVNL